ncbi:uncharacterized protein LOC124897189 [Capsicum annuum]|uniref:uncharacterized protein LOC124897189 n=1 Tax=Capsicum annuum TaxID=4072 RepID=UPI001FB0F137|nr:uncharacterized protein LOC124897189 [Capsicum annuum]
MNIPILLRHSGIWKSETSYNSYQSDAIIISESTTFLKLVSTISMELDIDEVRKKIEVKYVVEGNSSPIVIRNDNGVKVYVELKKQLAGLVNFSLCISTCEKDNSEIEFDKVTGAVMCIEGSEYDSVALIVVETNNQYALYVPKMEVKNFITDCKNTEIMVSQIYKDKETLVSIMARHAITNEFNTKAKLSEKKSYVLICRNEDCKWVTKSSCMNESELFVIKTLVSEHSCSLRDRVLNNVVATTNFVSEFTTPKLINHKRIHTPADIIKEMKDVYGVEINYMKAWRAKEKVIVMLRGGPTDGYRKMPCYIYMLNQLYPQSHIQMHKAVDNEFKYLFIVLRPMIRSFEFCRPIIVVDGAHLNGSYEGTFVLARTLDGAGFLEEVRILFAAWNCKNNKIASYTNTTLGRRFEEILTHNGVKALRMTVKPTGSYL